MITAATSRLRNWQSRLAGLVSIRMVSPFAWGTQDCALFAADSVQACTGIDPAADVRGTYNTAAQAQQVLQANGGLVGLAIARLGPVVAAALAQPGDIGLANLCHTHTLAVCVGPHFYAPATHGLAVLQVSQVLRVWRCTRGGSKHG